MSALQRFATMLGIGDHQAEDALRSERAARAVLSRRSLLAASGALAAGSVFSFPTVVIDPVHRLLDLHVELLLGSIRSVAAALNVPFVVAWHQTEEEARRDLRRAVRESPELAQFAAGWRP